MAKHAVLLFSVMIMTLVKLSLASCNNEYLEDIEKLNKELQTCPENCTKTALVEREGLCCLRMNFTSADECRRDYFIEGLESLGSRPVFVKMRSRLSALKIRFKVLTKTGKFDRVKKLTCKAVISSKEFFKLLKFAFQQLCNLGS